MNSIEKWVDIPGYEGFYQINNYGVVKSLERMSWNGHSYIQNKERIITQHIGTKGRKYVTLCKDGKPKHYSPHRLMMLAFIPNPDGLPSINHKDEDPTNNFIYINPDGSVDIEKSNLEWCTVQYNNNYGTARERSLLKKINNQKQSVPVLQFLKDGTFIKEYPSSREVERQLNISHTAVNYCCLGKKNYKTAGGFVWQYKTTSTSA